MNVKSLLFIGAVGGALAFPAAGEASSGVAAVNAHMRAGPGTSYAVIATIPRGAPVEILGCPSWCEVVFAGKQGYVAGNLVVATSGQPEPYVAYAPPPPPVYEYPAYSYYDDGFYDDPFYFGFGGYPFGVGGYHHSFHSHGGDGGHFWWPHHHH